MSKALSLKLRDDVFRQVEQIIRQAKIPRNTYINRALEFYNSFNRRKQLRKRLLAESRLVSEDSMRILREFEVFGDPLPE